MFINNIPSNNVYVYQSWETLGIMGVNSRTRDISLIYKKGDKEDIAKYRHILSLNLGYKIYTTILKNRMQETLVAIIDEKKKEKKKNYITHTFYHT